jgi:RNA polymerase sigma-70 factor (ECF subfamily)
LDADNAAELPAGHESPETILIDNSRRELLQDALGEIPAHYREILLLCEVEEMSYRDIAETLSVPIGTVMSRLSRARQTLRAVLTQKTLRG